MTALKVGALALAAAVVGGLAAAAPLLALVLGAGVGLAVAVAVAPILSLALATLSIAVSPEFFAPLAHLESAFIRGHRLVIIVAVLALLAHRGAAGGRLPITLYGYGVVLVLSFTFATPPASYNVEKAIFALLTLNIGWLASRIRWTEVEATRILTAIGWVPLVSVMAGVGLQVLGLHEFTTVEYTGVSRLQGASIAAHLALMAVGGTAASLLLYRLTGRRGLLLLAVADFAVVASTRTRGAIVAAALILLPTVWRGLVSQRSSRSGTATRWLTGLVLATIGLLLYVPPLIDRTFNADRRFDNSGRAEAWNYFLDEASENIWFGRGIGSAAILGEEANTRGDFRGVHNDVLRAVVEGGVVGATVVFGSVAMLLREAYRRTRRDLRADLRALIIAFMLYAVVDNVVSTFHFFLAFGLMLRVYSSTPAQPRQPFDLAADGPRQTQPLARVVEGHEAGHEGEQPPEPTEPVLR